MKLSLTVITGNAEQYIGRFLDHFQHLADEIVVVRACGDQDPDNTLKIAQDRGCIIGEYFNQEGTGHWPHVDNFAAARNKAALLATGDWLAWADTDDIISKESCKGMREMLAQLADDIDIVLCPYEVPDDGITHNRERFWRKGRAKWKNAIHECLEVEKTQKAARFDNVAVVHMPIGPRKPENNERNLRILEQVPLEERTASQLFYTMQAQRSCGNVEGAIQSAQALAAAEDAGLPERYEAFIFLGQLAPDPTTRAQLYLQAVAVDPSRREAYGELCLLSLASNRFDQALAWSDAMWGLKKPRHWYWNSRRKFHSWLGVQLRGMALRGAGRPEEASALELNHFTENGAKISLLHATRGRPKQAWLARQTWLDKAKNADAIEHIFAIDYDDDKAGPFICCRHVQNRAAGPVAAWNEAAKASNGQILVQMSDDFDPPMYWDEMILEAIGDTSKSKVLAVSDGNRKDDLLCMAILTRARYNQQGYLFHPEFFSMYSDNWFSEQAFLDGVVIDARDKITFQHNHPAFGKGEMDETYSRSNSQERYKHGEAVLQRLRRGDDGVSETGVFESSLHETQFDSPSLAVWLATNLDKAHHVHDLGCGNGFIVEVLNRCGFNATGYEGDPANDSIQKADLTEPIEFAEQGQTVCIEVGEHIPQKHESQLIANMYAATASGCLCIISWAVPGQPGRGHVNCLTKESVIKKMGAAGFIHEAELTDDARASITDLPWLKSTMIVFRKP